MKTNAGERPRIQRIQGCIQIPYNISQVENGYEYDLLRIEDTGQVIDLDFAKIYQKKILKQAAQNAIAEGVLTTSGVRYDCDSEDRSNMVASVMMMQLANLNEIVFIDYYNQSQTLTLEGMIGVGLQAGAYYQSLLYKKNQLYADVDTKNTIDDVLNVTW